MMSQNICDYSGYDYKTEFWENGARQYEHAIECSVLRRIFKKYAINKESIIDAGCGFGRLFSTYQPFFSTYTLIDYAQSLLDQAEKELSEFNNIHFLQASLYSFSTEKRADVLLSIRTLHHLNDLSTLFQQFNQALDKNGLLILDIPNKIHLKNRIKSLFFNKQLYSNEPLKLGENFYNYHPNQVLNELRNHGFDIIHTIPIGLFRIPLIKQIIPIKVLIFMEKWGSIILSKSYFAPNIYVIAKKCG